MTPDGHRARAEQIERTIQVLVGDNPDLHHATIIEDAWGAARHYIAYGMQRHAGRHLDGHIGLIRALNAAGLGAIAELFRQLEALRAGHWYGGQVNGHHAQEALTLLEEVKKWSLT